VWRWDQQEPFGNNTADENPDSNSVAFDLPLRLPGQRYDAETGLHYNYFRDYDPSIGRYGESDPIGLRGGLNTYTYVSNRPIKRVDPRGLEEQPGGDSNVPKTCRPSPCIKNCLDKVLGEDVGGVDVITEGGSTKWYGYAITEKNKIYVNDSCSGFFSHPPTVLEEYYHVTKQWNPGRLTTFGYVWANTVDGGYEKNRWEVEAKGFANNNVEAFRKCIACCR